MPKATLKGIPKQHHQTRKRFSFPWEVAVYSTNSASVCRDATLKVLQRYKIPATKITVFIPKGAKEDIYKETLKTGTYTKIVEVTGNMDVFINDYFPVGTAVLNIQDNVKGFLEYGHRFLKSLLGLIQTGFQECEKQGARLWGIYPYPIASHLKPVISTELKYISRCFFGCISLGSNWIRLQVPEKADYERSILYFKQDKKVIRLNSVAAICRPVATSSTASKHLAKVYPEYTTLLLSKKGTFEIRLRTPPDDKGKDNG